MKRILTTLAALIVCSSAAFGQSAPAPECLPWEKFFNYDGGAGAPVPGSLTGSLTAANGVTMTINVVAPSRTRTDGTRPIWQNGGQTIYGGTSGSNVDYIFSAPIERLHLRVADLNDREGATITGFLGAVPVYPEFISLDFGATITGPNQNIVIGFIGTDGRQASARYTFSSPVDRVELRPAPTQPGDFVIHGHRRCGFTSSIELIKSVSSVDDLNGNGVFGDAGDRINYDFFVVNTGNVPLADINISDDGFTLLQGESNLVPPVSGFDSTLAVGEGTGTNGDPGPVLAATATYIIHPTDTAAGMVANTATVSGYAVAADDNGNPVPSLRFKDSTGADLPPVEATSDAGSDPAVPTQDGTAGGSVLVTSIDPSLDGLATPTLLNLPAPAPSVSLTQSIAGVEDTNGNGVFGDAGDTVTYDYFVANTGNTSLDDVTITDPGFDTTPAGNSFDLVVAFDGDLAIGEGTGVDGDPGPVLVATGTYVITPDDVVTGMLSASSDVQANPVTTGTDGEPTAVDLTGQADVTDVSDAGTTPAIPTGGTDGGTVVPTGVATPATDDTDGNAGTPIADDPVTLTLPTIDASIALTQSIAGVEDTNGNGIFGDAGDTVTYDYFVANTGNTSLDDVTITDPGFDTTPAGNSFDLVVAFDGDLAIGEGTGVDGDPGPVLVATGTYVITPDDVVTGMLSASSDVQANPVTTGTDGEPTAVDLTGQADVTDVSDAGTTPAIPTGGTDGGTVVPTGVPTPETDDTDGNAGTPIADDPVTLTLPTIDASIALTQSIADVEDTNGNGIFGDAGDTVTYVYSAQNVGNTSLAGVGIAPGDEGFAASLEGASVFTPDPSFDLQSGTGGVLASGSDPVVIGTATYVIAPSDVTAGQIVTQPTVTGSPVATGPGNVPLPGTPLVDAAGAALPPVTDLSDTGTGSNLDRADGSVSGVDPAGPGDTGNDPTVLLLQSAGNFVLTKSAGTERVLIGETVTYEITATSLMDADFAPVQILDTLPSGLAFTPGSATIDGVAVEAVVSGQTITFSDLTMPANGSLTIGLQARVLSSAPAGALTNTVDLIDQLTGDALASTAAATVMRAVESVFDCSPVIGKVFDDVNMNGYQDQAPDPSVVISNQDIFVDKLGRGGKLSAANIAPQAEVGMPGVRLVTPSGTIITTDANGLYSVPCAEIPSGIGSNFMLKLDTRTLPTGYRVTTENPRVMRLTSGIMTEMNFGAAIGRVFDVDLSGRAYGATEVAPSDLLVDGLRGVLRQIADTPTIIRISYYRDQETAELARDRLNAIEDLIEASWADIGSYRLLIEKSVNQLQ